MSEDRIFHLRSPQIMHKWYCPVHRDQIEEAWTAPICGRVIGAYCPIHGEIRPDSIEMVDDIKKLNTPISLTISMFIHKKCGQEVLLTICQEQMILVK